MRNSKIKISESSNKGVRVGDPNQTDEKKRSVDGHLFFSGMGAVG